MPAWTAGRPGPAPGAAGPAGERGPFRRLMAASEVLPLEFEKHCWAEVDLDALAHNFKRIAAHAAPAKVCAVVKAGASLSYVITDKNVTVQEDRMLMGHHTYPLAIAKGSVV